MKKLVILSAAFAAMVSCQKETPDMIPAQNDGIIRFEMAMPQTKAGATVFDKGDQVGVFAVEYESEDAPELQIAGNFLNNEKLTFDGSEWSASNTLYWSDKPCDFYAVYPYQQISFINDHRFEIASDQNKTQWKNELVPEDPDYFQDGKKHGKGIKIDNLIWAPVCSSTPLSHYYAETSGCPEGWRLPTMDEYRSLYANKSEFDSGYYFSGSQPYSEDVPRVWFAARGREYWGEDADDAVHQYYGTKGYYWTSQSVGAYGARAMVFDSVSARYEDLNAFEYLCYVRCVTDAAGTQQYRAVNGYEASDLLWAKAEKVSHDDGNVKLNFKHVMSKCVVTVSKGEEFEGEIPDDIVCHIYNTVTTANFDIAAGSVEKDAMGERKTITMKKINNKRFEAIVVPQHIENRTPLIEVTMGGIAYLLEYSITFKPGYTHTINLILNTSPDQEKIEISIDAGVDPLNN